MTLINSFLFVEQCEKAEIDQEDDFRKAFIMLAAAAQK